VDDVDSLHVEIDNLNDPLVGFCFIRSIDVVLLLLMIWLVVLIEADLGKIKVSCVFVIQ
jgi:hypothetical protein